MTILLDHNMEVWHNKMLDQGRAEGIAIGRAEGIVEGARRLVLHQTTNLFGADIAERLAALLSRIDDPEHLINLSEVFVKCKTGEEFLSRVERDLG